MISDVLTLQEAYAKGITTETGVILGKHQAEGKVLDNLKVQYGMKEGLLSLSNKELTTLLSEEGKQSEYAKAISKAMAKKLSQMSSNREVSAANAAAASRAGYSVSTDMGDVIAYSDANGNVGGGSDIASGASINKIGVAGNYFKPQVSTGTSAELLYTPVDQQATSQNRRDNLRTNDVSRNTSFISDVRVN
jgi:hypothetical protein